MGKEPGRPGKEMGLQGNLVSLGLALNTAPLVDTSWIAAAGFFDALKGYIAFSGSCFNAIEQAMNGLVAFVD